MLFTFLLCEEVTDFELSPFYSYLNQLLLIRQQARTFQGTPCRTMVRKYLRKPEGILSNRAKLGDAIRAVKYEGISANKAAKRFNVGKSTLLRHLKNQNLTICPTTGAVSGFRKMGRSFVFDETEEESLVQCLRKCSEAFHGLTTSEIKTLAYVYAIRKNLKIPQAWRERKQVGTEWYRGFMRTHPDISAAKVDDAE